MSLRLSIAFALLSLPALAQEATEQAPDTAPKPLPRPEGLASEETGGPEAPEEAASEPAGTEPEPDGSPPSATPDNAPSTSADDPSEEASTPSDATGEAPDEQSDPPVPPMREVLAETPEELAACLAELDALGVVYEQTEPVTDPDTPACGIANPVTVSEIASGLALEPALPMRCATALAAARWAADTVVPFARKLGRGEVTAIDQSAPYVCRPRADGQMSEHAWGNALDVMGFRFSDGEPLPIVPRAGDGTIEEAFQRAVRAGACLDFETVLGPGSDEDHADHLHFDIRARDGGYRICE